MTEAKYNKEKSKLYCILNIFEKSKGEALSKYARAVAESDEKKMTEFHNKILGDLLMIKKYDYQLGKMITEWNAQEKEADA